jgi:hypothetical protein
MKYNDALSMAVAAVEAVSPAPKRLEAPNPYITMDQLSLDMFRLGLLHRQAKEAYKQACRATDLARESYFHSCSTQSNTRAALNAIEGHLLSMKEAIGDKDFSELITIPKDDDDSDPEAA